jgi:hypothetical protein
MKNPIRKLNIACGILFFIGGLNLAAGVTALVLKVEILLTMGLGFWTIVYGGVFLILGFWAMKKSAIALGIGIGLFLLDTILSLFFAVEKVSTPPVGILIARILLIFIMIQGFLAVRIMRNPSEINEER